MKVSVDFSLCEGNGRCVEAAPEVFALGADDKSRVLVERPSALLYEKVRLAARLCPRQAIEVSEP
jgi:ferredoxin